jgi:hypothetical protein
VEGSSLGLGCVSSMCGIVVNFGERGCGGGLLWVVGVMRPDVGKQDFSLVVASCDLAKNRCFRY